MFTAHSCGQNMLIRIAQLLPSRSLLFKVIIGIILKYIFKTLGVDYHVYYETGTLLRYVIVNKCAHIHSIMHLPTSTYILERQNHRPPTYKDLRAPKHVPICV